MSAFYQEELKKLDVVTHLEELRRRILVSLVVLVIISIFAFMQGDKILAIVKRPIRTLVPDLIYIGPTEAFVSYLKISLLTGFIIGFPVILYHAWAFISPAILKEIRGRIVIWFIFALALFMTGITFSYYVAIPAALKFLINFGQDVAIPRITLGKYVSFFGALIMVGGIVFEIPVVMALLTDAGIIKTRVLREKRHFAVLIIMIFAAVITPTQDVLNMLMFAIPMVLLYEVGLLISKAIERRK